LEREKDCVERLLLNIMPKSVCEEMKDYGTETPQLYESTSLLMADFVGHTEMAIARDPAALVTELNDIFKYVYDIFGPGIDLASRWKPSLRPGASPLARALTS
jgi:hypothetical protein